MPFLQIRLAGYFCVVLETRFGFDATRFQFHCRFWCNRCQTMISCFAPQQKLSAYSRAAQAGRKLASVTFDMRASLVWAAEWLVHEGIAVASYRIDLAVTCRNLVNWNTHAWDQIRLATHHWLANLVRLVLSKRVVIFAPNVIAPWPRRASAKTQLRLAYWRDGWRITVQKDLLQRANWSTRAWAGPCNLCSMNTPAD